MAGVTFQIGSGDKARKLVYYRSQITLGKSADCSITIPLKWLEDQHVVFQRVKGVVRIKSAHSKAKATLGNKPVTDQWMEVPPASTLMLLGANDSKLAIEVICDPSLVEHPAAKDGSQPAASQKKRTVKSVVKSAKTKIGTVFGLATIVDNPSLMSIGSGSDDGVEGPALRRIRRGPNISAPLIIGVSLGLLLLIGGIILAVVLTRKAAEREVRNDHDRKLTQDFGDFLDKEKELVGKKDYAGAKSQIDAAGALLVANPPIGDDAEKIRLQLKTKIAEEGDRNEIKFGGALGYVEMEGRWLPPDDAKAWREAHKKIDPQISDLLDETTVAFKNHQLARAWRACKQATLLIDEYPVKPAPNSDKFKNLIAQIEKQAKAAGVVLVEPTAASASAETATQPGNTDSTDPAATSPQMAGVTPTDGSPEKIAYIQSQSALCAKLSLPPSAVRFEPFGTQNVLVVNSKDGFRVTASVAVTDPAKGTKNKMYKYICKLHPQTNGSRWDVESIDVMDAANTPNPG